MIVKCEQCQTRFKIPDDKVTEKGVKVRCTKCQYTFRVKKEGAGATEVVAAAAASREADPFAQFGAAPEASMSDPTRPGVFALGVEATRRSDHQSPLKPSFAAQADLPAEVFEAETRIGPLPSAPPGRRSVAEPPVARPSAGAGYQFSPEVFEAPTRSGPMPSAPPGRRPLTDAPPHRPPPPAASPSPFDFASLGPATSEASPFDFSSLNPPAETTQRATMPTQRAPAAAAPPTASAYEPQPFDFSVLDSPPPETTQRVPMPMAPAPPKPSAFEPQPFDFSALDAAPETTERAMMALPPAPAQPSSFEPPSFDFSQPAAEMPFEFSEPEPAPPVAAPPAPAPAAPKAPPAAAVPPPMPRPSPSAVTQNVPFPTAGPPGASLLGDLPDPFAEETRPAIATVPPPSNDLSVDFDDGLAASKEERGSLFDMSDVPAPAVARDEAAAAGPPTSGVAGAQGSVPLARIALKKAGAQEPAAVEAVRPAGARRALSVVGNGLFAVVILAVVISVGAIFANDGKVDAASFSWTRLKSLFSHPQELVVFDITNGLYDTRAGRPVFFVRGEVKNRGTHGNRVRVRAEILDGEDLVRAAEGWAGANPSPEDLFGIATADDLTKLSERLASAAVAVAPGEQAPFLVTFYEYPPELKGFRVKVTVVSQTVSQTAER